MQKCHLRSLYSVSPDAAEEAIKNTVTHTETDRVKSLLGKHVPKTQGQVFWLRDGTKFGHWAALTQDCYTDESRYYQILDYDTAVKS